MRIASRLFRKTKRVYLLIIPLILLAFGFLKLKYSLEPLWREKHGFELPNNFYDRCMDLRFMPVIIEGYERLSPWADYLIPLRSIYTYYCADLVAVSSQKCSRKLVESTINLDGDEVYSTIYPENAVEDLLSPKSLLGMTIDLKVRVTKFENGKSTEKMRSYRISNPARLEAHRRHIAVNKWMAPGVLPSNQNFNPDPSKPYLISFTTDCSDWLSDRISDDYNAVVLGLGTQWIGFGSRLLALRQFLPKIPRNSTIIWADAGDVAFLPGCNVQSILETFQSQESPILFAGEMYCWPDGDKWPLFPEPPHEPRAYRYLNAGSSIGYAWAYLDVLNFMHAQEPISLHADDQRFWQQAYLQKLSFEKSNPKPFINNDLDAIQYIKVDFHQKLLVAFGAVVVNDVPASEAFNYSEYKQTKRIIFKESGGKPCIFHQPGTKINGQPKELMKILDKVKSLQD